MKIVSLLFLLVALFGPQANASEETKGKLLNGTAALVNKKVVTVRDAFIYRSLNRLKSGMQPVVLEEEGDELRKTVQKLVFEEMVLAEMANLQKEIDVSTLVGEWKKNTKKDGLELIKRTYLLSDSEIQQRVSRTLKADRFVQMKIETVTPVITEDETQKYFKRNEAQFRGRSYESIRPNIVVLLKKQAVQRNLEEWIKALKDKFEVSMLLENG